MRSVFLGLVVLGVLLLSVSPAHRKTVERHPGEECIVIGGTMKMGCRPAMFHPKDTDRLNGLGQPKPYLSGD